MNRIAFHYTHFSPGYLELGLPVYATGTTPVGFAGEALGEVQVPVVCGGVVVLPGDYILGDEDGVVVVPKDRLEEVIAKGR